MIGMWNFKEYDTKNTLPFSETFFQCFRKECDEEKELKNIQLVGVQNMINKEFLDVMLEIYDKSVPPLPKLPNKYAKWTYEENQDDFLAYLGTPKLAFLLKMLRDHPVRLGKRFPVALYTNYRLRSVYIIIDKYEG
ncbi:MAG: hypothetical protein L6R38_000686 [Xanthoria sp. 2 TBL-2021]|nr:MAG: hypothetical protein L6R38_000686 [Xanthoria sp. 2 TBL-2021]